MNNKALIIGSHPICESIKAQYEVLGYKIEMADTLTAAPKDSYHELCILPQNGIEDNDTLQALEKFAKAFPSTPEGQSKPLCHLLLHDKMILWLLQTLDLYPEIEKKFELYAFTMEDQWAKTLFCSLDKDPVYPPLDREKIDYNSNKTVHLVVAGFGNLGESLALHAALTAHYPNYVRNQSLRTRITIIDNDLTTKRDAFVQRYVNLFAHSYYRTIDLKCREVTLFHEPLYNSSRKNFVDVEWEFVDGEFFDPVLQNKLKLWSDSPEQLLTIALCDADHEKNFSRAFALPKTVYQNGIPVLINVKQSGLLEKVHEIQDYYNLFPIGMDDCGYNVRLPLLQLAKRLNYFYVCSFGQKGTPTDMPLEEIEKEWHKVDKYSQRYSNINNVITIATKMRSLGHKEKDWDAFFALTQEEIEVLSAVEHNRWNVERLIMGFRPPTDSEREEIRENIRAFIVAKKAGLEPPKQDLKNYYKEHQKVHNDLCAYRELGEDKTGQNVRVYDHDLTACIPLIAQSFKEALS